MKCMQERQSFEKIHPKMSDSDCSDSPDYEDEFATEVELPGASSDLEESCTKVSVYPKKSRSRYESEYERFEKWCEEKNMGNETSEKVLLAYFEHKSKSQKPSSLMTSHSMLRTVISMKRNVDISKYNHLNKFLKRKSAGYQAKPTKILSREDVIKFLQEADDSKFLMIKVAVIFGLAARCGRGDLTYLLIENVKDEGQFFKVVIPDINTKIRREYFITAGDVEGLNMVDIVRKYIALRPEPITHSRFFVTYRQGTCTRQPVGIHTFGAMPKIIATFLKLPKPEEYTGHCFRRLSSFCKR